MKTNTNILVDDLNVEYPCSSLSNSSGFTPLMHAVMAKDLKKVKELILNNSKEFINIKNTKGWTALHLACRNSNIGNKEAGFKIIELLLEYKADPNLQNNNGKTALMLASRNSNTESSNETVKLLLQYKADPNLQDSDGWIPLMSAVKNLDKDSTIETVKLLLKYGAKFDYRDFSKDEIIKIMVIKHNLELKELKKKHEEDCKNQKLELLKEIYAPGGIGMEVAKERFEMCKKLF